MERRDSRFELVFGTSFSVVDVLVPLTFAVAILLFVPLAANCEFNTDEGINLMKAVLYGNGFALYREIWSDQPPLYTIVLAGWMQVFGQTMASARILTWTFSLLLIFSFYQTLRLQLGRLPACVGTFLLVNSYKFIALSGSVMIGLPAIALAMLSVYLLARDRHSPYRERRSYLLVGAGLSLGLSLQIKLFTVFAVPLAIVLLLGTEKHLLPKLNRLTLLRAVRFFIFVALGYLAVSIASGAFDYEQLLGSHVAVRENREFSEHFSLVGVLRGGAKYEYYLFALAAIGSLYAIASRRLSLLLPLLWFALLIALFANHHPVWRHYYPLFALPMCWLAAIAVAAAADNWTRPAPARRSRLKALGRGVLPALAVLLVLYSFAIEAQRIWQHEHDFCSRSRPVRETVIAHLQSRAPETNWLFTDRPIYGFHAGLLVPPEIAVFSQKRLLGGALDAEQIRAILERYQPEQVLLERFDTQLVGFETIQEFLEPYTEVPVGAELSYYTRLPADRPANVRDAIE